MTILCAAREVALARGRTVVTYSSECSCENDHGVARWRAKTDPTDLPSNRGGIQTITPSEICDWVGPGTIPHGGSRTGNELRFYALTGRVISMGAEADGDVHLVLENAYDEKPGKVIAEIPLGAKWCAMRTAAFSWTDAIFPFDSDFQHSPFHLVQHPIITVVGKAFYDTDHSGENKHVNRRPRDKDKAVWEIHPVMGLEIKSADAPPPTAALIQAAPKINSLAPPPVPVPSATIMPEQFATITKPVTVKIPYGETVLQPGTKLPIVSQDGVTVRVRYLGGIQTIPIGSTDLH